MPVLVYLAGAATPNAAARNSGRRIGFVYSDESTYERPLPAGATAGNAIGPLRAS